MVRIAAVQLAPVVGDLAGNQSKVVTVLAAAIDGGADIVVIPELSTSGYVFESVDEVRALAIPADSPMFDAWAAIASQRENSLIIGGFAELGDDGQIYNSAAVVSGTGILGVYRKVHLWDEEKLYFTPGDAEPLVLDTPHGRLGIMICFDLEFPEWTRIAALRGTEILIVPTNWPFMERPAGERVAEVQIGIAAARVNRMAVVCADRAGVERGVEWNEGTSIIDADGWVLAEVGSGAGVAWSDIDPARSRDKKFTALADVFRDRRPDLYGALLTKPASGTEPSSEVTSHSTFA